MSSMVAMELTMLANLSLHAFSPPRTADAALLTARADELRGLIRENLWDEALGTFANKFSTNGSFYRRISPTSFYPLLAGAATDAQAARMVSGWLMNASRFCIAPAGDYIGNTDSCYWGLPSISADDAAYPPLGYWRGFVWGPMMALTYWSLQQYDHVPVVRQGRRALVKQMHGLGLSQWRQHRHVCENFGPHKNTTDCTGDHFYHWGGLAGFIGLVEAGYY